MMRDQEIHDAKHPMTEKQKCANIASHRYTWPGEDESFACFVHAHGILAIAQATEAHQQMIPLKVEDHLDEPKLCQSFVETEETPDD